MEELMVRPKVSVIIPLYNTEDYIGETLDSIRNQTLREIEIIVVNDGSTDRSREIVAEAASTDTRITLLDQQNQGQSIARNNGIDNAHGEYIYFMDSDDLLDLDTLERCYVKCKSENLDLVIFDAVLFGVDSCFGKDHYRRTHLLEDKVYSGTEIMQVLMNKRGFSVSPCLYLIRHDYLKSIALRFVRLKKHEDELFTPQLFVHAVRIGMIPEAFFKRRLRDNSIMTDSFARLNMECYFTAAQNLLTIFSKESEAKKDTITRFVSNMLNAAVWRAHKLPLKDKIWCAGVIATHYLRYIKLKNIGVLMFKR